MKAVSIIVAAYNAKKTLPATLESVLAQTVGDWEVVVVNDGSTDETGAIAENFARRDKRIRVVHQANAFTARARNRGFAAARKDYEYCMLLDHDDLFEPDALEILLDALEKDPEAVAAHGVCRHIDNEGKPMALSGSYIHPFRRRGIQGKWRKDWPVSAPTSFAMLAYLDCIPACGIMIRRAKKDEVGDFDPNCRGTDDWDLWLRLSRLGHIAFVNRVVVAYRIHEGNFSQKGRLMREGELYVRKKMYTSPDLNEHEKKLILTGYQYYELYRVRLNFSYTVRNLLRRRRNDAFKSFRLSIRHLAHIIFPFKDVI